MKQFDGLGFITHCADLSVDPNPALFRKLPRSADCSALGQTITDNLCRFHHIFQ